MTSLQLFIDLCQPYKPILSRELKFPDLFENDKRLASTHPD